MSANPQTQMLEAVIDGAERGMRARLKLSWRGVSMQSMQGVSPSNCILFTQSKFKFIKLYK